MLIFLVSLNLWGRTLGLVFLLADFIVSNKPSTSWGLVSDWKVTVGRVISLKCLSKKSGLQKPIDWSSESQGRDIISSREEFGFSGDGNDMVSSGLDGNWDKQWCLLGFKAGDVVLVVCVSNRCLELRFTLAHLAMIDLVNEGFKNPN